jgi:predicted kinase
MLARRYAYAHALALIVDTDDIRRHLGGWRERDESKVVARDLAIAMTRDHLERGHDVIVPQYLASPEFRDRLRALAGEVGSAFVEIVLTDEADTVIERFELRRRGLAASGADHPEAELANDSIATEISQAIEHLRADAVDRGVTIISSRDGFDSAYDALMRCVASHRSVSE